MKQSDKEVFSCVPAQVTLHPHPHSPMVPPKSCYPFTSIRSKAQSYWAMFLFALYPKRKQPWISRQPSPLLSLSPISPGKRIHLRGNTFLPGADHSVPTPSSLPSSLISPTDLWSQLGLDDTYPLRCSILSDFSLIPQQDLNVEGLEVNRMKLWNAGKRMQSINAQKSEDIDTYDKTFNYDVQRVEHAFTFWDTWNFY